MNKTRASAQADATTTLHPDALRRAVLDLGPRAAAAAEFPAGWCLAAAGLTREMYASLGFPGVRILGVRATVFNSAAWDLRRRRVPVSEWPDDAWSLGVQGTGVSRESGWDGHAVAYVPARLAGGQAWLIDLSAPQMSRPSYGIHVPPLALRTDASFFEGDEWFWTVNGAVVTMTLVPHLTRTAAAAVLDVQEDLQALADLAFSLARQDYIAASRTDVA